MLAPNFDLLTKSQDVLTDYSLICLKQKAEKAAYDASKAFFEDELKGNDTNPRGYAWVEIIDFKGTRLTGQNEQGLILKRNGIPHNEHNRFGVWKPGKFNCQNMEALMAGAEAFAQVFNKNGFAAYAYSRLNY